MLAQWIITLGSRTPVRTDASRVGKFEEQDYRLIEKIVREDSGFSGCTIVRAKGYFQGKAEDTVQIIVLEANYEKIKACAQLLRETFRQESVMVVCAGVGEFLTAEGRA